MRTTLNLKKDVINKIMQYTGTSNKSKAVNMVLESYIREKKKQNILKMKGNLHLEDNWKQTRDMELDEE